MHLSRMADPVQCWPDPLWSRILYTEFYDGNRIRNPEPDADPGPYGYLQYQFEHLGVISLILEG